MAFGNPYPYTPQGFQQGFPPQPQVNYPLMMPGPAQSQQNGQGWYAPPPQETELDVLKAILQKLDEIQKGMVKHEPHD